jgi:hypothetical protein
MYGIFCAILLNNYSIKNDAILFFPDSARKIGTNHAGRESLQQLQSCKTSINL